ncbi:MAG: hypothetical protein U0174_15650 [Polyangiaceae bacterium]|mgnify:CR=1 FL=1
MENATRFILLSLGLTATVMATACGTSYNRHASAQLAEVRAKAAGEVFRECQTRPNRPEGEGCGLFLEKASSDTYRALFRDRVCKGKTEEECQERFERLIDGVLSQRYYRANFGGVKRLCDDNPRRCEGPYGYELRLLESHNFNVETERLNAERDIEAERRAASEKADDDVLEGIVLGVAVAGVVVRALPEPGCRTYPQVAKADNGRARRAR